MKGYIINNRCYVFPQEVGQLPSIDAEVIYVQEEDIKAWKEANGAVADKIKKYNYNVITVNPKEWSGHKDDELGPSYITITRRTDYGDTSPDQIVAPEKALPGENVTISLADTATYTFNRGNKAKQRIWINADYIDLVHDASYYNAELDQYNYTMPSHDIYNNNQNLNSQFLNGHTLTLNINGVNKTLEEANTVFGLSDAHMGLDITDLTDIFEKHGIKLDAREGYTFDKSSTDKTIISARMLGYDIYISDPYWISFEMPEQDLTLEITTTAPQTPPQTPPQTTPQA